MEALSFDTPKYLEWEWCGDYGTIEMTDETMNYGNLQIDVDIKAMCIAKREAGDFYTPELVKLQHKTIDISNIRVFDEDGIPQKLDLPKILEIELAIKEFIHEKI